MNKFSKRSLDNLSECHQDIQTACNYAIKYVDFTVIKGHRGEKEQNEAYDKGNSQLRYPKSKHNKTPSKAFDFIPYPFDGWDKAEDFTRVASFILGVAAILKEYGLIEHRLEWGGNWNSFSDRPHIQIK